MNVSLYCFILDDYVHFMKQRKKKKWCERYNQQSVSIYLEVIKYLSFVENGFMNFRLELFSIQNVLYSVWMDIGLISSINWWLCNPFTRKSDFDWSISMELNWNFNQDFHFCGYLTLQWTYTHTLVPFFFSFFCQ